MKWTPAVKFCRSCGAHVVAPTLFGAARMLKDAGADRFAIPKMLVEFDPEQIENFSRIYQSQAVLVARHVDDLRFLQGFLRHRHWGSALEDDLLAQLPLAGARLAELGGEAWMGGSDLDRARFLLANTPIPATRSLAALVLLRLGDTSALQQAWEAFRSPEAEMREEAALALSHWRVLFGPGLESGRDELVDELRRSPFEVEAAVRLAALTRDVPDKVRDGLVSADPDISFSAALAMGDRDRLVAALSSADEQRRLAAALRLASMNVVAPLKGVLAGLGDEGRMRLLERIGYRKDPVPELRDDLYMVADAARNDKPRRAALRLLALGCPRAEIARVCELARGESSIYQTLLQSPGMEPEALEAICDILIDENRFSMSQFGMKDAAKPGRVRCNYVPRRFAAASEEARCALLEFAEQQLEHHADENLHRFVVNVAFGEHGPAVHRTAWTVLHRWYQRIEVGSLGAMQFTPEALTRFFGSPCGFVPILTRFLRRSDSLRELFVWDRLWKLLTYASPDLPPHLRDCEDVWTLLQTLADVSRDESQELALRQSCDGFAMQISHGLR